MIIKYNNLSINILRIIIPIIYILIGFIIFQIVKKVILKSPIKYKRLNKEHQQKIKTIKILFINIIKYIIITIILLAILSEFGVNVKSILAGLGIGTAIIGLAFQDLAKDIIAGFSIMTEGEYEVGDTIEVDGFMGEVISISLRTTRIRNFKGATKIISNRHLDNIINYSEHNSLAIIDIDISYENNETEIEKAFNNIFKRVKGNIPYATKEPEILGVQELSESSVVYRIVVETEPTKNYITERYLRKEIKKELDNSKIKIPYPQIEVHNGK